VTLMIQNVGMRFGGLLALDKVSFQAPRDKIVSIIGPNGAGKTTLFAVLSGFLTPTTGSVSLDGMLITGHPAHEVAKIGIARTFQIVRPFRDMTVRDNVMVGAYARTDSHRQAGEFADHVLERVRS